MTDSYFVSKPSPHLANFAKEAQKSALGIQDDVYGQRLRDAAKKSQQSQQHGFQMGQIGRKGELDAYNTGLGMGINLPQTLAGQRNALATGPIRDQLGQARTAINLGKSAPYFAALDKQGLRVVPESVQNIPLAKILETLRLSRAPTSAEADIQSAKAWNPQVKNIDTAKEEVTGTVYIPGRGWVQRKTVGTTKGYGTVNPRTSTMTPVTTGSTAIIERAEAAGKNVPKTAKDMALRALRSSGVTNPNDQQMQMIMERIRKQMAIGGAKVSIDLDGTTHTFNVIGIDANGNLIYE